MKNKWRKINNGCAQSCRHLLSNSLLLSISMLELRHDYIHLYVQHARQAYERIGEVKALLQSELQ